MTEREVFSETDGLAELDWNRLGSGSYRALDPQHQWAFDKLRDAERYRKLRAQNWHDGVLCVVRTETVREPRFLGVYCPSGERLDELVDELIKD